MIRFLGAWFVTASTSFLAWGLALVLLFVLAEVFNPAVAVLGTLTFLVLLVVGLVVRIARR